jgi:VanZ family protein
MGTLTLLSVIPIQQTFIPDVPFIDKYQHILVYFVASFLCLLYRGAKIKGPIKRNEAFAIVIFHISYGLVLELVQHYFISGRFGEFLDFLANSLGVLLGMLSYFFIFKRISPLK